MSDTETFEELYTMARERVYESNMGLAVFFDNTAITESALFVDLFRKALNKDGDGGALFSWVHDQIDAHAQREADRMQFNRPARFSKTAADMRSGRLMGLSFPEHDVTVDAARGVPKERA
jgi:hypothetical protein